MQLRILALVVASSLTLPAIAGPGDTTTIRTHDAALWNWYGAKDAWTLFPPASQTHRKITMFYTLGCPSQGCSTWDYSTKIEVRHRTGEMDSTAHQAPSFTVDGTAPDSIYFQTDTTWIYFFDSATKMTDSFAATAMQLFEYGDTLNPTEITDSSWIWPGNYYNYRYDTTGVKVDSIWVGHDFFWKPTFTTYYTPFEVIETIELARVMTPYAGDRTAAWTFTMAFDVTDYAPILHDSVEIRAFFGGWQNGFTITLDFEFIEGIPPRDVKNVHNIYHSGMGGWRYGFPNDPIEAKLKKTVIDLDADEEMAMFRLVQSGHSFGGNQNCAEFCPKRYYLDIDGTERFRKWMWRNDCSANPVYPQTGNWLSDRAGWCPGAATVRWDHEITEWITAGSPVEINVDLDNYTYTGGAGFDPNYIIDGQLFTYGLPNHQLDAEVIEILSPNNGDVYNRFNPICAGPRIVIRNAGATPLTKVDIHFGNPGNLTVHHWVGSLEFMEVDTVTLPMVYLDEHGVFEAGTMTANDQVDDYPLNNVMRSNYEQVPEYIGQLVVFMRTNLAPAETSWRIYDLSGNVVASSQPNLTASTNYRDTLNLPDGCYTFVMTDSDEDGLSNPFSGEGAGFLRFIPTGQLTKVFESDFGDRIVHQFYVGEITSAPKEPTAAGLRAWPNPAQGTLSVDIVSNGSSTPLRLFDMAGVSLRQWNVGSGQHQLDISGLAEGVYVLASPTERLRLVISR